MIDITPEGLRIQLVDQDGKPLFPLGSAEMFDYTRDLIKTVSKAIMTMPNDISVRGHTDANKYAADAKYTNWELSADRANASRRVLIDDGINPDHIANVMGRADRENLIPDKPLDPRNRRISIIMLRETVKHAAERGALGPVNKDTMQKIQSAPAPSPFQKTPGAVYFP
jgi:chemotaxis protein MotB